MNKDKIISLAERVKARLKARLNRGEISLADFEAANNTLNTTIEAELADL